MFQLLDYYGDSYGFADTAETAQAWVNGMNALKVERITRTGGNAVADHFEFIEVVPMTAETVAQFLATESAEQTEYLKGFK